MDLRKMITGGGRLDRVWRQGDRFSKWDWVLFGVLALFCYFSFAHRDLVVTGNRGWMLYQSSLFDYYDVLHSWTGDYGANYMPSTFLLYAVWVLPLKLLGFQPPDTVGQERLLYVMWYKLLPVLFYIASAYLIYRVAKEFGLNGRRAKVCMFAFLTLPVALFSQFIFSQYDIFTVFFVLLGMYFHYRGNRGDRWLFCLFFGIAVTFKYFALLIFFVLLLLDEKRVRWILAQSLCMALPFALEFLPFCHSEHFMQSVFGFSALQYAKQGDFSTLLGSVSFFQAACCFFVLWAYFIHPRDRDDSVRWGMYLCCGVCFGLFGFATWHPQWLIFAAPFWVLSAFINRHLEKFLWMDFAFVVVFYPMVVCLWPGNVDDTMLLHGVWKYLLIDRTVHKTMADIISKVDSNVLYTVLFVLILVFFVFKHPKNTLDDLSADDGWDHMWLIRLRLVAAVLLFAVPAFLSLYDTVNSVYLEAGDIDQIEWIPVYEEQSYEQYFSGVAGTLDYIEIELATYERENTCGLTMQLIDVTSGEELAAVEADPETVVNCGMHRFSFSNIDLTAEHEYCAALVSKGGTDGNCFAVGIAPDTDLEDGLYGLIDGTDCEINYCLIARVS